MPAEIGCDLNSLLLVIIARTNGHRAAERRHDARSVEDCEVERDRSFLDAVPAAQDLMGILATTAIVGYERERRGLVTVAQTTLMRRGAMWVLVASSVVAQPLPSFSLGSPPVHLSSGLARRSIAPVRCPRDIRVVKSLPRTETGKVEHPRPRSLPPACDLRWYRYIGIFRQR